MCVYVCILVHIYAWVTGKRLEGVLNAGGGGLCDMVNAVVGSLDFILQESVNHAETFRG